MSITPSWSEYYEDHRADVDLLGSKAALFVLAFLQTMSEIELPRLAELLGWDSGRVESIVSLLTDAAVVDIRTQERDRVIRVNHRGHQFLRNTLGLIPPVSTSTQRPQPLSVNYQPSSSAEILSNLAKLLRRIRRFEDLSAAELAHASGVSRSTLQRWETGKALPSLSDLARVMAALAEKRDPQVTWRPYDFRELLMSGLTFHSERSSSHYWRDVLYAADAARRWSDIATARDEDSILSLDIRVGERVYRILVSFTGSDWHVGLSEGASRVPPTVYAAQDEEAAMTIALYFVSELWGTARSSEPSDTDASAFPRFK